MRDDDILATKYKPRSAKKQEIQKLKQESKYTCEKCARCYTQEESLTRHKKLECNVVPLFKCEFCEKLFERKIYLNVHVVLVHTKPHMQTSISKHNCGKCSRSYRSLSALYRH
ncbi:putative zinc finger protein 730 [Belonocnema kinseyi]|uniref:putative zinc finger protein 730 n=1 Tax=Belonocnema kinseyi TaxID=2817044 RepID=UPI00143D1C16|nr:putative zinc finger protein 730 [Belonocnema kinseyi]